MAAVSKLLSSILPSKASPPQPSPSSSNLPLPPRVSLPKTPSWRAPVVATWTPSSTPPSSSLASILWPSLAYSNTLFFKSAYNVQIVVQDNDSEEKLVGRFRKEVLRAGVLQECKTRRFFENKREKKQRKTRQAARKNRKRYPQSKDPRQDKPEATINDDKEDDNWDYDVELPYH
ncbi:PREDICTED: 30S ribosomal S21 [Prunus dulcis]|uniref:PREDICTED: 30S ribosomal S21 n=1 Tax=Prunus dulcis TaxID=3755 RepID=A0A5E4F253_PRUDU|nr:30S ribosomal protein S21, chloroplastic [Prunus dulcis]VVA21802.1 PREDICTED: 30S ribosomal S21 [Prunus dulcis]